MFKRVFPIILIGMLLMPIIGANAITQQKGSNDLNKITPLQGPTWTYLSYKNVTQPPIIADLFFNGTNYLVLVTNTSLNLAKVDGTEIKTIWSFDTPNGESIVASPVVADFDGDGVLEIATVDSGGNIYFIGSQSGALISTIATETVPLNKSDNLVVFDFDYDGYLDIVFLANREIVVGSLAPHGFRKFSPTLSHDITSGPIIFDYDNDSSHTHHIVFSAAYELLAFRPEGELNVSTISSDIVMIGAVGNFTVDVENVSIYEFVVITKSSNVSFMTFTSGGADPVRFSMQIDLLNRTIIYPVAADFDNDGLDEALIAHINGSIYIVGSSGIEKEYTLQANATSAPAISNLDGDSYVDAIITLENGSVIALDYDSTAEIGTGLEEPKWPLVWDVDNDGSGEVLVVVKNGLELHDLTGASNDWSSYLHDLKKTNNYNTPKDSDGDGLIDDYESVYGTSPTNSDNDDDLLTDFTEIFVVGTYIDNNDTDNDNLTDGWEFYYGLNASNADSDNNGTPDPDEDPDGDNITNINEFRNGTSPLTNDTDNDGLGDYEEIVDYGTDPTKSDTDDDGMPDGWEVSYDLDPLDDKDAQYDNDTDGLSNLYEYGNGTDPFNPDTDSDGMPDGWEVENGLDPVDEADATQDLDEDGLWNSLEYLIGSDPQNNDTDNDNLPDGWEYQYGLNPLDGADNITDTDGDGLTNIEEYRYETNPKSADTDDDGMPDGWEVSNGFNPKRKDDYLDPDNDGLTNVEEYVYGTDPHNGDTDDDGLLDGVEVHEYGTDPLSADTDGDGLLDAEEIVIGTNPLDWDTDGDGISDQEEVLRGTDPLDPANGSMRILMVAIIFIAALASLVALIFQWIREKKK